jgi:hypothetical protein
MKIQLLKTIALALLISGFWAEVYGQTVNNVKLLDLTGNSYSSGSSFHVPIGSQMQVTDNYTFECWLYVNTKPSGSYWPVIMDRRTVFSFYIGENLSSGSGDYGFLFATRDGADNIINRIRNDGQTGTNYTPMFFQEWYHVAVSSDGTKVRLFLNGTAVDSNSTSPDFVLSTPSGNEVNYGARYWGSYKRFIQGAFDEMRYSDIGRYTTNFTITTNTPPHDTAGDPNTILLFNFNTSNLKNSTSANSYTATAHGTLTYIDWDGFPSDKLPLPVEYYKPLSATINDNKVKLSWITVTERNNRGFIIERSKDGEDWKNIGFHGGAGNSNLIKEYEFIDKNPLPENYYRLKQFDYNGKTTYSKTVFIAMNNEINMEIYPNPAKDIIFIKGNNRQKKLTVSIFNSSGKKVMEIKNAENSVDISELKKGIYFITVCDSNKRQISKRFIKTN